MFFSKKTAPSVSVCIPVYKTEGVLSRCLESVAAQNFDAIEIIVVDDCSPGKMSAAVPAKVLFLPSKSSAGFRLCI